MSTVPSRQTGEPPVVVQLQPPGLFRSCLARLVLAAFTISVLTNLYYFSTAETDESAGNEKFVSGDKDADDKIAIIPINGTIMPPFTERVLKMIENASEDDDVKGVILSIDSPGGLVADSHQMYHRLKKLAKEKKIYVSMKRVAASGGVYAAMGVGEEGKIFAEPTTWTGSIGVIIPRYDFSGLGQKYGVASDSLTTGEFKDSLNPLKPLSDADRKVWGEIMEDSFARFIGVIAEGRKGLDEETVRNELATGQVFTAEQAKTNGLIDDIKYEDEVIDILKQDLKLTKVRVMKYTYTPTTLELLLGQAKAQQPQDPLKTLFDNNVPRAMYYFGWGAGVAQPPVLQPGLE